MSISSQSWVSQSWGSKDFKGCKYCRRDRSYPNPFRQLGFKIDLFSLTSKTTDNIDYGVRRFAFPFEFAFRQQTDKHRRKTLDSRQGFQVTTARFVSAFAF